MRNFHTEKRQATLGATMARSVRSPLMGFTLVEMIVSVGLFIIVLFIATSSFLAIVNADRKSRAVRIATDNLNLSLEDMQRKIKTGYTYNCGGGVGTNDCTTIPEESLAFSGQDGVRVIYARGTTGVCGSGYQGCILRTVGANTPIPITSPEINVESLKFLVKGSDVSDTTQPAVVVSIKGSIGTVSSTKTDFSIQTVVTQRNYDR